MQLVDDLMPELTVEYFVPRRLPHGCVHHRFSVCCLSTFWDQMDHIFPWRKQMVAMIMRMSPSMHVELEIR